LLHYIVLVLLDDLFFGGFEVSGNRPAVAGSLLLLIIPLVLAIAYPFFMCVALTVARHGSSQPFVNPLFCSYVDAPSVKLARIFCDFVFRKKQVEPCAFLRI
jgi:hypothetical protein